MSLQDKQWRPVCNAEDLILNSGVCVLINEDTEQEQQVAVFSLADNKVYALGNYDPIGKANVLYRGIVGNLNQRLVVASPLYKQHFDLQTGQCLEDNSKAVPTFDVRVQDQNIEIFF